jgi:hypothetical protein
MADPGFCKGVEMFCGEVEGANFLGEGRGEAKCRGEGVFVRP